MFPSLWDRRSKLEKYLLIIILVLFILCAILVVVSLKEVEKETRILHVKQHPNMGELIDYTARVFSTRQLYFMLVVTEID